MWPLLMLGSTGPEVGNWQRFLRRREFNDASGSAIKADEQFGPKTVFATRKWQEKAKLPVTGQVGLVDRSVACDQGFIPFIQAKNYTQVAKRDIHVIVIHTMEAPDKPKTSEAVSRWFASLNAPRASAHYCVGQDVVIQCVRDMDIAWHAPGMNSKGIGIEHQGYAKQSAEDWLDEPSQLTLKRSAELLNWLAYTYDIPLRKLSTEQLKAGEKGVCGHIDVTNAFQKGVGHWDPGPNFPWQSYLAMASEWK